MMAEGSARAPDAGSTSAGDFTVGNAEALAFPDKSFDAYTIAFGIRNVTHIDRALAEAFRVLKPGGKFLCLEFSHVDVPGLDRLYDAYSFTAIPAIGKVVTGDGAPYRYLVESIRTFPDQERFEAMIERGRLRARPAIAACRAASSPSIGAGASDDFALAVIGLPVAARRGAARFAAARDGSSTPAQLAQLPLAGAPLIALARRRQTAWQTAT